MGFYIYYIRIGIVLSADILAAFSFSKESARIFEKSRKIYQWNVPQTVQISKIVLSKNLSLSPHRVGQLHADNA